MKKTVIKTRSEKVWSSIYKQYPDRLQTIEETPDKGILSKRASVNMDYYLNSKGQRTIENSEKRRTDLKKELVKNTTKDYRESIDLGVKNVNFVGRKLDSLEKLQTRW